MTSGPMPLVEGLLSGLSEGLLAGLAGEAVRSGTSGSGGGVESAAESVRVARSVPVGGVANPGSAKASLAANAEQLRTSWEEEFARQNSQLNGLVGLIGLVDPVDPVGLVGVDDQSGGLPGTAAAGKAAVPGAANGDGFEPVLSGLDFAGHDFAGHDFAGQDFSGQGDQVSPAAPSLLSLASNRSEAGRATQPAMGQGLRLVGNRAGSAGAASKAGNWAFTGGVAAAKVSGALSKPVATSFAGQGKSSARRAPAAKQVLALPLASQLLDPGISVEGDASALIGHPGDQGHCGHESAGISVVPAPDSSLATVHGSPHPAALATDSRVSATGTSMAGSIMSPPSLAVPAPVSNRIPAVENSIERNPAIAPGAGAGKAASSSLRYLDFAPELVYASPVERRGSGTAVSVTLPESSLVPGSGGRTQERASDGRTASRSSQGIDVVPSRNPAAGRELLGAPGYAPASLSVSRSESGAGPRPVSPSGSASGSLPASAAGSSSSSVRTVGLTENSWASQSERITTGTDVSELTFRRGAEASSPVDAGNVASGPAKMNPHVASREAAQAVNSQIRSQIRSQVQSGVISHVAIADHSAEASGLPASTGLSSSMAADFAADGQSRSTFQTVSRVKPSSPPSPTFFSDSSASASITGEDVHLVRGLSPAMSTNPAQAPTPVPAKENARSGEVAIPPPPKDLADPALPSAKEAANSFGAVALTGPSDGIQTGARTEIQAQIETEIQLAAKPESSTVLPGTVSAPPSAGATNIGRSSIGRSSIGPFGVGQSGPGQSRVAPGVAATRQQAQIAAKSASIVQPSSEAERSTATRNGVLSGDLHGDGTTVWGGRAMGMAVPRPASAAQPAELPLAGPVLGSPNAFAAKSVLPGAAEMSRNPFPAMDALNLGESWVGAAMPRARASASAELQVGYQDPVLGYVELRAHAEGGAVHASLGTPSAAASETLEGHLSSLAGWMNERHTPVESLSVLALDSLPGSGLHSGSQPHLDRSMGQSLDRSLAWSSADPGGVFQGHGMAGGDNTGPGAGEQGRGDGRSNPDGAMAEAQPAPIAPGSIGPSRAGDVSSSAWELASEGSAGLSFGERFSRGGTISVVA